MSPDALVAAAGAGLAIILAFVPKVKDWYEKRSVDEKRQLLGGAVVATALLVGVGSCVPVIGSVLPPEWLVPCTQPSLGELARLTFTALGANQGVYWTIVKPLQALEAKSKPAA